MPMGAELVGHGRVGGGVGAGDAVALGAEHAGERGHRGAADADEVDVLSGWVRVAWLLECWVSLMVSSSIVTQVPRGMERLWEVMWPDWRPMAMGPGKSWRAWRQAASRSGSS